MIFFQNLLKCITAINKIKIYKPPKPLPNALELKPPEPNNPESKKAFCFCSFNQLNCCDVT